MKVVEQVPFSKPLEFRRKKVAAYARVSTGKDAMLHSLSSQISYYSNLIQAKPDWEFCGVYTDEAMTGTKDNRVNFQRLLSDCRAGKVEIIITKSISRFARNTVTLLETVRELRDLGVDVIFEEQNIRTLSAEGELLLTLLASFAQAESFSASENMKWRIRKGFENGELMNLRCLFGYNISREGIQVNEEQADAVREIFARAINGDSLESIARYLKSSSISGTYGGTITATRVRKILENEKYTGNALLQKTFSNNHIEKKMVKNNGELPQYYAEGTHEAIIDMETYELAQQRLHEISEQLPDRSAVQKTVFAGKIHCAKCGASFISAFNKKRVWQCYTYKKKGRDLCNAKQIPESILIQISCEVLGIDEFDDELFACSVESISADNDSESNILIFTLTDGKVIVKRWRNPSRSESWTPEMKAAASGYARKGRK